MEMLDGLPTISWKIASGAALPTRSTGSAECVEPRNGEGPERAPACEEAGNNAPA